MRAKVANDIYGKPVMAIMSLNLRNFLHIIMNRPYNISLHRPSHKWEDNIDKDHEVELNCDSSVSTTNCYGLNGRGWADIYVSASTSAQILETTQPHAQWALRFFHRV
jgi:hypothetical protein